ncbi:MAG: NAD-dependent epimerase/dehydratase family protein [Pseudomonadota bacterium]
MAALMAGAGGPPVLVTGAAGFIGAALSERLLDDGAAVLGVDCLSPYYDVGLKESRLARLEGRDGFAFRRLDIADRAGVAALFDEVRPEIVIHLAAQAGVRHGLEAPFDYADANLTGFLAILEGCRAVRPRHLLYASSSSVYGGNTRVPFSTSDSVDHPVSLYAATKKANELMAHSYSHLFGLPATGLRFFTVYGPRGRPDMAYWKFTERLMQGRPIQVYNHGRMKRDFTYVDDVVESVVRLIGRPPQPDPGYDRAAPDPATSWAPHAVYNIGNSAPEDLMVFVRHLERLTGRTAEIEFLDMQPGDVEATAADTAALEAVTGFRPATPLGDGLARFVEWYRGYNAG